MAFVAEAIQLEELGVFTPYHASISFCIQRDAGISSRRCHASTTAADSTMAATTVVALKFREFEIAKCVISVSSSVVGHSIQP